MNIKVTAFTVSEKFNTCNNNSDSEAFYGAKTAAYRNYKYINNLLEPENDSFSKLFGNIG